MIFVDAKLKLARFDLDVTFENDAGLTALFGRSGSGKSLTLKLIAGLARPDRGKIVLDETILVDTENRIFVPPHRRRVGLVFQDAQLFPHLSVKQNLLFGRWFAPRSDRRVEFSRLVGTLGLGHLLSRKPALLSGGEKQRVAIGRALLSGPKILLMDEPLASLDAERKLEILPLIEQLRDEFHIPIVYVSHAIEEVARLASRVVVLDEGKVIAAGAVEEVLGAATAATSESRFDLSSVITARISGTDDAYGLTRLDHPAGKIWLVGRAGATGGEVRLVIRATDVTLATSDAEHLSIRTALAGRVAEIAMTDGALALVTIDLDGHGRLAALATRKAIDDLHIKTGDRIFALIKTVALDERTVAEVG